MQNDELKPCPHEYVPTQVGHGLTQCKWCHGTMMENAFIAPNHCDTRAKQDAAWNQRTDADTITALQAEVARLREEKDAATQEAERRIAILEDRLDIAQGYKDCGCSHDNPDDICMGHTLLFARLAQDEEDLARLIKLAEDWAIADAIEAGAHRND